MTLFYIFSQYLLHLIQITESTYPDLQAYQRGASYISFQAQACLFGLNAVILKLPVVHSHLKSISL